MGKEQLESLGKILGGEEEELEEDVKATFDFIHKRVKARRGDIYDGQIIAMAVLEEFNTQIREQNTGEDDEEEEGE